MSIHPVAVIDTNVALDMLVFDDAACRPVWQAVRAGTVTWVASTAMRAELADVLGRGFGARWRVDPDRVLEAWDRHAGVLEAAAPCRLRCSDPDDQKFLDFAVSRGPCWLLTRDRALLMLAGRARTHAVTICTPARWPG